MNWSQCSLVWKPSGCLYPLADKEISLRTITRSTPWNNIYTFSMNCAKERPNLYFSLCFEMVVFVIWIKHIDCFRGNFAFVIYSSAFFAEALVALSRDFFRLLCILPHNIISKVSCLKLPFLFRCSWFSYPCGFRLFTTIFLASLRPVFALAETPSFSHAYPLLISCDLSHCSLACAHFCPPIVVEYRFLGLFCPRP